MTMLLVIGAVAWIVLSVIVALGFGRFVQHCDRIDARDDELVITVHRLPSWFAISMDVAPLVRRGLISDDEGHLLVQLRYAEERARLAAEGLDMDDDRD